MGRRFAAEGPFDNEFDVAHTTVHTGIVHGGTALNIVPKDCYFDFEFRYLPELGCGGDARGGAKTSPSGTLQPAMRRPSTRAAASTGSRSPPFPASPPRPTARWRSWRSRSPAATPPSRSPIGTEAGLYQQSGIPAIICGPGSIDQAHKPNEWVALDQLAQCENFMRRLMDRVCDKAGLSIP